jgi:hypothetical protein
MEGSIWQLSMFKRVQASHEPHKPAAWSGDHDPAPVTIRPAIPNTVIIFTVVVAAALLCTTLSDFYHTTVCNCIMALLTTGRGVFSRLLIDLQPCMQAAGLRLQQQAAWHTTDSSSSSSDAQQQAPGAADPFTRSLQSKTEQEVFSLLEKAKLQQLQQQEEEEDDDLIDVVNPETGQ